MTNHQNPYCTNSDCKCFENGQQQEQSTIVKPNHPMRCAFGWQSRCRNLGTHKRNNGGGKQVWACDKHKQPSDHWGEEE